MYIELIDLLRCPRDHEESWLIAAFAKMDGRFVIEGKLGCHICSASYTITDGVADLREGASDLSWSGNSPVAGEDSGEAAMRVAAMLNLTRPGALVLLEGDATSVAVSLSELTESRVIVLNPTSQVDDSERVATVFAGRIPLAAASADGIVLSVVPSPGRLRDVLRVLKPGGRLAAPAGSSSEPMLHELARDDEYVVSESIGQLIKLSR